jgi:shikimate dehydrogenase
VDGFLAPLRERARDWRGTSAVILGNGGAARAVAVALVGMGCGELRVVGRDPEKLAVFKGSWTDTPLHDSIEVHGTERLPDLAPDTGLLVNTTPLGMSPRVEASPAGTEVLDRLPPGAIVYDLIYNPQPTRFLQLANERGLVTIDGLEMLVQQGAIALELWLGRPAPVGVMREALSIADP